MVVEVGVLVDVDMLVDVCVVVDVDVDVDVDACVVVNGDTSQLSPEYGAGQVQLYGCGASCSAGQAYAMQSAAAKKSCRPISVEVVWQLMRHPKSQLESPKSNETCRQ